MDPNVITFSAAAEQKGCGRNTLYRAAGRGEIQTADVGGVRMILLDEAFAEWAPQDVGGRIHRNRSRYGRESSSSEGTPATPSADDE